MSISVLIWATGIFNSSWGYHWLSQINELEVRQGEMVITGECLHLLSVFMRYAAIEKF